MLFTSYMNGPLWCVVCCTAGHGGRFRQFATPRKQPPQGQYRGRKYISAKWHERRHRQRVEKYATSSPRCLLMTLYAKRFPINHRYYSHTGKKTALERVLENGVIAGRAGRWWRRRWRCSRFSREEEMSMLKRNAFCSIGLQVRCKQHYCLRFTIRKSVHRAFGSSLLLDFRRSGTNRKDRDTLTFRFSSDRLLLFFFVFAQRGVQFVCLIVQT